MNEDKPGKVIRAAKVPRIQSEQPIQDKAALIAYHYPQYTYEQALDLNVKLQKRLMTAVRREQAAYYLNMISIVSAPYSKNGKAVKSLADEYKKTVNQ